MVALSGLNAASGGLVVGDWIYSIYQRSAPEYLPLNSTAVTYLQASYPALAAVLPTQFKLVVPSNSTVAFPSSTQWYCAAYGNGIWVAGSYTLGVTARSTDNAITWSAGGTIAAGAARGLAYGAGLFFAASGSTAHASSPDGVTWTARTTPISVSGVAFGGGIFAAVGTNNAVSSTDGITWTTRTIPAGAWDTIIYGGGMFVAIDRVGGVGASGVVTSTNGIDWVYRAFSSTYVTYDIAYGNGMFVIMPYNGPTLVITSTDGITWTAKSSTFHSTFNKIAFGGGVFASFSSNGGAIYTSIDGVSWTGTASAGGFAGTGNMAYGTGGVFVVTNNNNTVTNFRFSAEISTTVFYLPVITALTNTFTYVKAT